MPPPAPPSTAVPVASGCYVTVSIFGSGIQPLEMLTQLSPQDCSLRSTHLEFIFLPNDRQAALSRLLAGYDDISITVPGGQGFKGVSYGAALEILTIVNQFAAIYGPYSASGLASGFIITGVYK